MKTKALLVIGVLAAALLATASARAFDGEVVGYIADTQSFPNMLDEKASCSKAYDEYLAVARPLNACEELGQALSNADSERKIAAQMKGMKNCKSCVKEMVKADEAAAAYQEQANIYKPQCPSDDEQQKLTKKLPGRVTNVCQECENKWPGQVGPAGGAPCK
jgi:hypothetical protein